MNVPLRILHAGVALSGDVRAWFVPGVDAEDWLRELLDLGVDLRDVVLLPVPRSRRTRDPLGVVVLLPPGVAPHHVVRALPWTLRADCVLFPADAALWPPVNDDELPECVTARWLVMHPTVGPVAFGEEDALRVTDLFTVRLGDETWDRARPGGAPTSRLVTVAPAAPVAIEQFFAVERHDIGVASPRALPRLPGESEEKRPGFRVGLRGVLARFVFWATRNVPRTASAPTWINRLEDWAARQRSPARPRADKLRREREVQRLLEMLVTDPDRGLRHALPLGGGAGRGIAEPGNRLGTRITDFDARRLGGGREVDPWNIAAHVQLELGRRYREIATREIAAGRHRRAAYIFAHLLGDLRAAAQVLRDGGHYREAAVLYRDRLRDVQEAVRCLVAGRLLGEAAELAESTEGNAENAGDLRLMLGEEELAMAHYRRAHASMLTIARAYGRPYAGELSAALLRAEKLRDVEGGLQDLERCWQVDGDPRVFAAWLALLQRLGRSQQIVGGLARLESAAGRPRWSAAAQVLGAFVRRVPAGPLRDAIRDFVRRAVAAALQAPSRGELECLFEALRRASPDDRVLARDTQRMLARSRPPAQTMTDPARRPALQRLWQNLASTGNPELTVPCGSWWLHFENEPRPAIGRREFAHRGTSQVFSGEPGHAVVGVQPARVGDRAVVWRQRGDQGCLFERLDPVAWPPSRRLLMTLDSTAAFAVDDDGAIWTVASSRDSGLEVRRHSADGSMLAAEMPRVLEEVAFDTCHLVALQGHLVLASGSRVFLRRHDGNWLSRTLGESIHGLVRSEEGSNPLVLVRCDRGFRPLHVFSQSLDLEQHCAADMDTPALGWTRNGIAIAVDDYQAHVFSLRSGGLEPAAPIPYRAGRPSKILTMPAPDQVLFIAPQTLTCVALRCPVPAS